jgi:hypothetical protein
MVPTKPGGDKIKIDRSHDGRALARMVADSKFELTSPHSP